MGFTDGATRNYRQIPASWFSTVRILISTRWYIAPGPGHGALHQSGLERQVGLWR